MGGIKMSDTPNERTLKLALEVFTELANTLKQERDEARKEVEYYKARYEQERDTLVQKLDAWQEIAEHLHHLVQHPAYGVEQAIRRMDVLEAYKHLNNGH